MDRFADKLRTALNNDVAERLLVRYFASKGFDKTKLDQLLYPPLIQDMQFAVSEMSDKIEVVPYVRNIDPLGDTARLGWNLFVLGNQRCYLGETFHMGLKRLTLQLQHGQILAEDQSATRQTTPRRIIKFVTRVFEQHEEGYINLTPRIIPLPYQHPRASGLGMAQQFWSKPGGPKW
ncbi:MAG: hypothetical protein WC919_00535 [Candidatus Paceibacterota bacterium]|jgi:hypothetical protein